MREIASVGARPRRAQARTRRSVHSRSCKKRAASKELKHVGSGAAATGATAAAGAASLLPSSRRVRPPVGHQLRVRECNIVCAAPGRCRLAAAARAGGRACPRHRSRAADPPGAALSVRSHAHRLRERYAPQWPTTIRACVLQELKDTRVCAS